jgi:hypothetical protein
MFHSIFLFFIQILVYDLYVHKSILENDPKVSYYDNSQVYIYNRSTTRYPELKFSLWTKETQPIIQFTALKILRPA